MRTIMTFYMLGVEAILSTTKDIFTIMFSRVSFISSDSEGHYGYQYVASITVRTPTWRSYHGYLNLIGVSTCYPSHQFPSRNLAIVWKGVCILMHFFSDASEVDGPTIDKVTNMAHMNMFYGRKTHILLVFNSSYIQHWCKHWCRFSDTIHHPYIARGAEWEHSIDSIVLAQYQRIMIDDTKALGSTKQTLGQSDLLSWLSARLKHGAVQTRFLVGRVDSPNSDGFLMA